MLALSIACAMLQCFMLGQRVERRRGQAAWNREIDELHALQKTTSARLNRLKLLNAETQQTLNEARGLRQFYFDRLHDDEPQIAL